MARNVGFYMLQIDKRYIDKTKGITRQGSVLTSAHFVDDTELINPVMKLSTFDQDLVNYVHIPSLDRWYYVTGVTYSKGYYYVQLHVDVTMSFLEALKQQEVILKRSEKYWDLFLQDDKFKTEQWTCDTYKPFTGGNAFHPNTDKFVLTVMGSGETSNNEGGE